MKKSIAVILTITLAISSAMLFTACGEEEAPEVELMGISKYSRTQFGELMEYDVTDHRVNENGQITQFDVYRTNIEKVGDSAIEQEHIPSDNSIIVLERDDSGSIAAARTEIPGYGYQMHELTYKDGLIDTDSYSSDWSTLAPYTLQYTYEKADGNISLMNAECIQGDQATYPYAYEYNDTGDVDKVVLDPEAASHAYVEIEYDENGNVTKITNFNADGPFLVREFEYTSLGQKVKAKTGFQKWQEFDTIDKALLTVN